jgi:hypothetical protein
VKACQLQTLLVIEPNRRLRNKRKFCEYDPRSVDEFAEEAIEEQKAPEEDSNQIQVNIVLAKF